MPRTSIEVPPSKGSLRATKGLRQAAFDVDISLDSVETKKRDNRSTLHSANSRVLHKCETGYFDVLFPFEPYACQKRFMTTMAEALQTGQHSLIESPTGTGKTMCILSTALAYQKSIMDLKENAEKMQRKSEDEIFEALGVGEWVETTNRVKEIPRIWYATRTHNQLRQVIAEFKNTTYYDLVKSEEFEFEAQLLGSRDHYCVHKESATNKSDALERSCRKMVSNHSCFYHNGCSAKLGSSGLFKNIVRDLDELKKLARRGGFGQRPFCPFYASRENLDSASIVFLPYNYLVNGSMRERLNIKIEKDIVILDEAHNIESTAEDATSFDLDISTVEAVQRFLPNLARMVDETDDATPGTKLTVSDLELLTHDFDDYCSVVIKNVFRQPLNQRTHDGGFYGLIDFEEFEKIMVPSNLGAFSEPLQRMQLHLEGVCFAKAGNDADAASLLSVASKAASFRAIIGVLCNPLIKTSKERFKIVVKEGAAGRRSISESSLNVPSRVINFWSFAAHVAMEELFTKCHSVVVTSGTLQPMGALALQLSNGLDRFVNLENDHVIGEGQVFASIIGVGPSDELLELTYKRFNESKKVVNDIGHIIADAVSFANNGGVLVFFPSYGRMHALITSWKASGIMQVIGRYANVFVEAQDNEQVEKDLERFIRCVNLANGTNVGDNDIKKSRLNNDSSVDYRKSGIFFAPYRGRISEGLSMSDHLVRVVICIGIPFPSAMDLRVELKQKTLSAVPYMNKAQRIDGNVWYNKQAATAVNQAIGRVVRHKNDFGAVLLIDSRYNQSAKYNELSKWVRDALQASGTMKISEWSGIKMRVRDYFLKKFGKPFPEQKLCGIEVIDADKPGTPALFVRDAVITASKLHNVPNIKAAMSAPPRCGLSVLDMLRGAHSGPGERQTPVTTSGLKVQKSMLNPIENKASNNKSLGSSYQYTHSQLDDDEYDFLIAGLSDIE